MNIKLVAIILNINSVLSPTTILSISVVGCVLGYLKVAILDVGIPKT